MPYITQDRRQALTPLFYPMSAGELNFAITSLVLRYLEQRGSRYEVYNEIVGVLECAKLEFYRRAVITYENEKMQQNGDVYP